MKYFICEHCGNIIEMVEDKGVPVMCCGQKMTELVAGEKDGALEKHVPVYTVEGNVVKVKVGEVEHPMLDEHYIQFIAVETEKGYQRKALKPAEAPEACFALCEGDKVVAVYEYCNLHGLWKA
ncbi:MAG: desulfoferrodoxin [Clostridiales bacterium]|nr:desulfoferrodoxin [Clostridiales bacterium]MDD7034839.1 desulfoferrodoxin family protein [Bacillota bacterium]MDY2919759.1 desulfoferrodoxin family protein [Lentihominibacter sp.]